MIEAGYVYLPNEAPWLADFMHEMINFPNGKHDDGSGADVYSVMLDSLTLYCRGHFDRAETRLLVDTTNRWLQSHIRDVDIHLKHCVNK